MYFESSKVGQKSWQDTRPRAHNLIFKDPRDGKGVGKCEGRACDIWLMKTLTDDKLADRRAGEFWSLCILVPDIIIN